MAGERREVVVYFRGVERDLTQSAGRSEHSLRSLLGTAAKVGVGVAGAFAARKVVGEVGKSIRATSDLNESLNKSNTIFGQSGAAVEKWANRSVFAFGMTKQEALGSASAFGDMFLQLGIGRPRAVGMSEAMTKLAADFASFHNADISDVLLAQQSAFRGEYDAVQRFVPGINAARVEQEALRLTHKGAAADLTQAEKAQAAYNIMLRDGQRASGDFGRTARELANGQRIAKAAIGQTRAELGQAFLPAARRLVNFFNRNVAPEMLRFARSHAPAMGRSLDQLAQKFLASLPPMSRLSSGVSGLRGPMRTTSLGFRAFWAALHGEGITTESGTFVGSMERIGVAVRALPPRLRAAWASFREGRGETHSLVPTLKVAGAAMGFVADHADLIAKHMPLLIGAIAAYKGAQALANVADSARVVLMPLQIAGTFALARANRSLAASNRSMAAGAIEATGAERVQTIATNLSAGSTIRQRVATIALTGAQKVGAVATAVFGGAWRVLSAAFAASPIGFVLTLLALLATGLILAYKHSATFRKIVQGAWQGIRLAASATWGVVRVILANLASAFLNVAGRIVRSAAIAFGWVPGVGPKLRAAAAKFEVFRGQAQRAIDRLHGKTVQVKAEASFGWGNLKTFRTPSGRQMFAEGGLFRGRPGRDQNVAAVSDYEYIVNPKATKKHLPILEAINSGRFMGGYALGGIVAAVERGSTGRMRAGVDRTSWYNARLADKMGREQLDYITQRYAIAQKEALATISGVRFTGAVQRYIVNFLQEAGLAFSVISGTRPGAVTRGTGRRSLHAIGRAVDVIGRGATSMMDLWRRAVQIPFRKEVIYSPAPFQVYGSGKHPGPPDNPITRADHYSHVHIGLFGRGGRSTLREPAMLLGLRSMRPLAMFGERGPEMLNATPVSSRGRVDTSATGGGIVLVDITTTIDGQVLERRLERVRARGRAGDPTRWGR